MQGRDFIAVAMFAAGSVWGCQIAHAQESVKLIGDFRFGPEGTASDVDFTVKKDARLSGLQPEMLAALPVIRAAAHACGIKGPVPVTSGDEKKPGLHTKGSAHYLDPGGALDFRTKFLPQAQADCWEKRLKEQLPADQFWIDLENEGADDEHLHVGLSKKARAKFLASVR